jgi:hypothetical protein
MPGKIPSHRILAKPPGSDKNTLEIGAIWQTSNQEVTSVSLKFDAMVEVMKAGSDIRAIVVPNRPKTANGNKPAEQQPTVAA